MLIDQAQENLDRDYLRRWWCRKYNSPPTDPRYLASTELGLYVEYVEDAIENGTLLLGLHGKPVGMKRLPDGSEVFETGDPEIDALERQFAQGLPVPFSKSKKKPDSLLCYDGPANPREEDLL